MDETLEQELLFPVPEEEAAELPATNESEPETQADSQTTTSVDYSDYLSSIDNQITTFSETQYIDYSSQFDQIHNDLSNLTQIGDCILFILLISYFVPFVKSLVHKFLFRKGDE